MQTIQVNLPDDAVARYQRGAAVARKQLAEFIAERLLDSVLPLSEDVPPPLGDELRALEELDDEALWQVARSRLSPSRERVYERLLERNSEGQLTDAEREKLHALGEEERRLTLKKAHAFLLLKWRGHRIPTLEELRAGD